VIQHFVFFKFKPGVSQAAVDQHLRMFAGLPGQITQISGYTAGLVRQEGEGPSAYDVAHYVTFASWEDLEIYLPHPAHQAFIAANRENWERVQVLDSQAVD
jgi:hypothetical protein